MRVNVSRENLRQYEGDGVTVVRQAVCPSAAKAVLAEIVEVARSPSAMARVHTSPGEQGCFLIDVQTAERSARVKALALQSIIPNLAGQIIGASEVYFFYDQLFIKEPKTSTRTQWHQDLPFWPLKGCDVPSLWLALSPVNESSSSVIYILGSHKWGKEYAAVEAEDRARKNDAICPDFHLLRDKSAVRMRAYELEPGDLVIHHPLVVHGAGPNLHERNRRVGISFRYCGPDVQWNPRPNTMFFPHLEGAIRPLCPMRNQTILPKIKLPHTPASRVCAPNAEPNFRCL